MKTVTININQNLTLEQLEKVVQVLELFNDVTDELHANIGSPEKKCVEVPAFMLNKGSKGTKEVL